MLADDNTSDREIHASLMRGAYEHNSAFDKYDDRKFPLENRLKILFVLFKAILNICFVNYKRHFGVNNHS